MLNYLDHRTRRRRPLHVVALTLLFVAQHGLAQEGSEARQIIRAGMIGLDTSHVIAFTRVLMPPAWEPSKLNASTPIFFLR